MTTRMTTTSCCWMGCLSKCGSNMQFVELGDLVHGIYIQGTAIRGGSDGQVFHDLAELVPFLEVGERNFAVGITNDDWVPRRNLLNGDQILVIAGNGTGMDILRVQ